MGFHPQSHCLVIHFCVLSVPDYQKGSWEAIASCRDICLTCAHTAPARGDSGFAQFWTHYTQSSSHSGSASGWSLNNRSFCSDQCSRGRRNLKWCHDWAEGCRKVYQDEEEQRGGWGRTAGRTRQDGSLPYLKSCYRRDWNSFVRLWRAKSELMGGSHRADSWQNRLNCLKLEQRPLLQVSVI